jgi:hypothetical protein
VLLNEWFDRATLGQWPGLKHYERKENPITQGRFIRKFRKLRLIADLIPYFLVGFQSIATIRLLFHAFIIIKIILCKFVFWFRNYRFETFFTNNDKMYSVDILERPELFEEDLKWIEVLLKELNHLILRIETHVNTDKEVHNMKLHRLVHHWGISFFYSIL